MIRLRYVLEGLKRRWGSVVLTIAVGTLGIAGLCLILWAQSAVPEAVKARIAETDMVVGPKSSGLDLALCCALHLTPARGLVSTETITQRLGAEDIRPYIAASVPVAMGDSYEGRRILWTTPDIVPFYQARVQQGRMWQKPLEIVAGAGVARELNLKTGQRVLSSHGLAEGGHAHEEAVYEVTGVLAPTGGVLDYLLLADLGSVALVHGDHDHEHDAHDHAHDHEAPSRVNAMLVRFRSQVAQASVPLLINESETLSAASPRLELARLMSMVRPLIDLGTVLSLVMAAVAALILTLSLVQGLNRHARDFMLLRFLGMSRLDLALLSVTEALIVVHVAVFCAFGLALVAQSLVARGLAAYGLSLSPGLPWAMVLTVWAGAVVLALVGAVAPLIRLWLAKDDEELRA